MWFPFAWGRKSRYGKLVSRRTNFNLFFRYKRLKYYYWNSQNWIPFRVIFWEFDISSNIEYFLGSCGRLMNIFLIDSEALSKLISPKWSSYHNDNFFNFFQIDWSNDQTYYFHFKILLQLFQYASITIIDSIKIY